MKRKTENPALEELKRMRAVFLAVNGAILLGCGIYALFMPLTWRVIPSLLLGDLVMLLNFWLCGVFITHTIAQKSPKKGQLVSNGGYAIRYIGIFLIYGGAMMLGLIDLIPAFLPLFIPKIYYIVEYTFAGKKYDDTAAGVAKGGR